MRQSAVILQNQISSIAEEILPVLSKNETYADVLKELKKLINRSREFENSLFLILVVGPVKSGKSTFVNLVSRAYVSPTDFLECTIRPSLITAANERNEITIYRTCNEERKEEQMEAILDYINGIVEQCEVDEVSTETIQLGQQNDKEIIDHYVTRNEGMVNDDIIMTAIETVGGGLLQEHVYLIDMPGIDGQKANLTLSTYTKIAERADLIVFVQSSNSAVSATTSEFLNLIRQCNNSAPVCLVHNVFDAAHWRSSESREAIVASQKEYAVDVIRTSYGLTMDDHNAYNINLGKVDDLRNGNFREEMRQSLEQESLRFDEVEKEMYNLVRTRRENIRISNCINRTKVQNDKLMKVVDGHIKRLEGVIAAYEEVIAQFEALKRDRENLCFSFSVDIDSSKLFAILKERYMIAVCTLPQRNRFIGYSTLWVRNYINKYLKTVAQKFNEYFKHAMAELNSESVRKQIKDWGYPVEQLCYKYKLNERFELKVEVPTREIVFSHGLDIDELVPKNKILNHAEKDVRRFLQVVYELLSGTLHVTRIVDKSVVTEEKNVTSCIDTDLVPRMLRLVEEVKSQYHRMLIDEGNNRIDEIMKKALASLSTDINATKEMLNRLCSFKDKLKLINKVD